MSDDVVTTSHSEQFRSAAHELAVGLTPPIGVAAVGTIMITVVTEGTEPAFSAFVGAVVLFVSFRLWIRYVLER